MCVGRISNFNIANRYKLEKGQRLEVVSNGSDSDEGSGETKKNSTRLLPTLFLERLTAIFHEKASCCHFCNGKSNN
jgi:hypothetical protein